MATLQGISALVKKLYLPVLVDNSTKSNILLYRNYRRGTRIEETETIYAPLRYADLAGRWYSKYDVWNSSPPDFIKAAEFKPTQCEAEMELSGYDEVVGTSSLSTINYLKVLMQSAEDTIKNLMGAGLFSDGTGYAGKILLGLGAAIDDGTNVQVYGGLDRLGDSPFWRSNVSGNSGTPRAITTKLMQKIMGKCSIDNDRPTLLTTTQSVWDEYMYLLESQQRFIQRDAELFANGGFQNILFDGRPVVVDSHVPNGTMYFINENYLDLQTFKARDMAFRPFQSVPKGQDAAVAYIRWMGQLTSNNCRMQGVLKDILEP
jgi:hypothetical protein